LGGLYFLCATWECSTSILRALGGTIGAWISVIQRNKSIDQRRIVRMPNMQLSSVVSVSLGAGSAFIVYWAITGNLALGTFKDNPKAMFVFVILAGMSERYLNSFCLAFNCGTRVLLVF
jgi:hypothetical protein